jgi:hypothetical protein
VPVERESIMVERVWQSKASHLMAVRKHRVRKRGWDKAVLQSRTPPTISMMPQHLTAFNNELINGLID